MGSYEGIRCWCLKFGRPTLEICGEIMPGVGLEPQSPLGRITPLPETERQSRTESATYPQLRAWTLRAWNFFFAISIWKKVSCLVGTRGFEPPTP